MGKKVCADMGSKEVHHIVGSAPGEISEGMSESHWLTCVNASVARVNRKPDLWIITDQLFDTKKNANIEALTQIEGRECRILLIVIRSQSRAAIRRKLRELNIEYSVITFVSNIGRALICQHYCGTRNYFKRFRPSNGVFAIIVSMLIASSCKTGSHRIMVSGINPLTINHFYDSGWGKRGHVQADQAAIEKIKEQKIPLTIL
ncbi:hypothetical protein N9Z25_06740 [Luminiphilus sp.]|nr:hypothetical protein [Luminiphilus sp.]